MQVVPEANSRLVLSCLIGYIGLAFSGILGAALPLGPEETVREFYGALERRDCEAAMRLRPGYRKEQCLRITNVKVHHVNLESQLSQQARVFVQVTYMKEKPKSFCGYANLEETQYGWVIKGKPD